VHTRAQGYVGGKGAKPSMKCTLWVVYGLSFLQDSPKS